jgi:hypothetical protein
VIALEDLKKRHDRPDVNAALDEARMRAWALEEQAERQRQEREVREGLGRAQELLGQRPSEAVIALEDLKKRHDRPDVNAALDVARLRARAFQEQAERERQEREVQAGLARARELLSQRPAEAVTALEDLKERHNRPDVNAALDVARLRARAFQEQAERDQAATALQTAARTTDPAAALRGLQALTPPLQARPEVAQAIEEYRAAIAAAERQEALSEIESLAAKGKVAKARGLHKKAVQRFGTDQAFEDLLARLEARAEPPPATAPVDARRKPLWAIAAVGAALLATGVWIVTHRSPAPDVALQPVEIRTDPAGASVQLPDRSCVTPNCRLQLAPGSYSVQARLNGYENAQEVLTVEAGKPSAPMNLTLRPIAPPPPPPGRPTGTLVVESSPASAQVFVDNTAVGLTGTNGRYSLLLTAAPHVVRVEKAGFETPRERKITIAQDRSLSMVFKLTPQNARLELRGAPAGVEIRANGTLLGRTDDSGVFSAGISPGGYLLRITEGSATRDIDATLTPGQQMMLDWLNVAPVKLPPPPPRIDIAEQDWEGARTSSDAVRLQAFIEKYQNGPHTAEAQVQLAALLWSRTNQNDPQSLQSYIRRFPNDPRAREAQSRLVELAWNGVDKKDMQALRTFLEQNPDSPHKVEIQSLLDQLEKKRVEAERISLEQARQAAQRQAEAKAILAALDRFNLAFEKQKPAELKAIWPGVRKKYLEAMTTPAVIVEIKLTPTEAPVIAGDSASIVCSSDSTTTVRGGRPTQNHKSAKVTLRNVAGRWLIVDIPDPSAPTN